MPAPVAFLNGQLIPADQAVVPVFDGGFMQGVTVSEQLRTFGGRLFRLDEHLERLWRSLQIVGVDPPIARDAMAQAAAELAARNHALLADGDDLGLSMFVTPGPYATFVPAGGQPLVGMHTFPLPFASWNNLYADGQSLVVTDVQQVPPECWPPELKCRSRMHYYLADQRARQVESGARALLLDREGNIIEASTANVVLYSAGEGFVSPPREKILPGISVAVVMELSEQLDLAFSYRDIQPADVAAADEVLLTSTSPCLLPVTKFNGQVIGDGRPGEIFHQLLAAWSGLVGLDIAAQAAKFSKRS